MNAASSRPRHTASGWASHPGPRSENQDAATIREVGLYRLLAIADGVSGSVMGGAAARHAVDAFATRVAFALADGPPVRPADFPAVFARGYAAAVESLRRLARGADAARLPIAQTTLIAALVGPTCLGLTYVGDGQAYLLRGGFDKVVGLMLTHKRGTALGAAVCPGRIHGVPAFLTHNRPFGAGEALVAGTDGIFDVEIQRRHPHILTKLSHIVRRSVDEGGNLSLALSGLLDDLAADGVLTDNATVGVITSIRAPRA